MCVVPVHVVCVVCDGVAGSGGVDLADVNTAGRVVAFGGVVGDIVVGACDGAAVPSSPAIAA